MAADGEERPGCGAVAVVDDPAVLCEAEPLTAADGEERLAGSVHEDDLGAPAGGGGVAVDAEGEVAVGVEDGEAVAVEEEGLAPHGEHQHRGRLLLMMILLLWVRGVGVNLGH